MAQPYVGEIRIFAGNFAIAGWMFCEGQLLPISEFETLFNLIGTTYGGDGQSTFALPDLRGRIPLHQGNGFTLAETGGVETADPVFVQQEAVGDDAGHDAALAHAANQQVQVGMEQRLAAAEGKDAEAERRQVVDAAQHVRRGYRRREVVIFIAIFAGQVAAADGDDVRGDGVAG